MLKVLFTALTLFFTQQVFACASCGSGSDEPLVLYPNESQKFYVGLGRASNFESANAYGVFHAEKFGPQNKTQLYLSYGKSLSTRSFLTAGLPLVINSHTRNTEYSYGDPLFSGRYTFLSMNFTKPYIPQIQFLASYKPAFATSIHESTEDEGLDIFGNGYHQVRAGVDIWSGMSWLQLGYAQTIGYSFEKLVENRAVQPGLEFRSVFSMGHVIEETGKLTVGLSRLYATKKKDRGIEVLHSEEVNNAVFLTGEYFVDKVSTVRLTLSRQAAVFSNRNTLRSDALILAYLRSF